MKPVSASRSSIVLWASTVVLLALTGLSPWLRANSQDPPPSMPTFNRDVAPILYRNCTNCHRPGEIGPMSLLTYRDARPWAKAIRENILDGSMPPWSADPHYGKFLNERRLSQQDIDTLVRWVNGGAREGAAADLPSQPTYPEGWQMGTPDAVFEMSRPFTVPADGVVDYQYFEVPTNFSEDKWIQAVEVRPGDRARVHHVVVHFREPKRRERPHRLKILTGEDLNLSQVELGAELATLVPGADPTVYPAGTAKKIAAGSILTLQIHYTTTGTAGRDQTKVGVMFAPATPDHEIRSLTLVNRTFKIPAGDPNYRVEAEATFTRDSRLWRLFPHAHLRARSYTYTLTYPDGRSEIVLSVPKFDFNWQTEYTFRQPLDVPAGTKFTAVAYFDNSRDNPWNPDPTVEVGWGVQTWNEMMYSTIDYSPTRDAARPSADGQQK